MDECMTCYILELEINFNLNTFQHFCKKISMHIICIPVFHVPIFDDNCELQIQIFFFKFKKKKFMQKSLKRVTLKSLVHV